MVVIRLLYRFMCRQGINSHNCNSLYFVKKNVSQTGTSDCDFFLKKKKKHFLKKPFKIPNEILTKRHVTYKNIQKNGCISGRKHNHIL